MCDKLSDNLTVAEVTIYIALLDHYQYPLLFPWVWICSMTKPLLFFSHSVTIPHEFVSGLYIFTFLCLLSLVLCTCFLVFSIGVYSSSSFLVSWKESCCHTYVILVNIIVFIIWLTVLKILRHPYPHPCGRETVSEIGSCWTGWSKVKIQLMELPQSLEGMSETLIKMTMLC